jgi:hypothetical protein
MCGCKGSNETTAQQQHAQLARLLKEKCKAVHVYAVPLGVMGIVLQMQHNKLVLVPS